MSDANLIPEPPVDPVAAAEWASFGRHALTYAGAALSAFGLSMPTWLANLTDPQITSVVAAVMFFGGGLMSLVGFLKGRWDKWQARRVLVASTVASVRQGTPVAVTVTPAGQPNDVTHISMTEQHAAPSIPAGEPKPAPLVP